jgi:replicative DNA helicase
MQGAKPLVDWFVLTLSAEALPQYVQYVKRRFLLRILQALFVTQMAKAATEEASCEAIITETEQALLAIRSDTLTNKNYQSIGMIAQRVFAIHRKRFETGVNEECIPTGLIELDYVIAGLFKGEVTVLGGRPSDGKSAIAMHIAMQAALRGKHVCFNSMEMTEVQTMNRIFAGMAPVDAAHLRMSGVTLSELERMERLSERLQPTPLFFDHTPANSVEDIRAQVLIARKQGRCDLLVVDYLQLIQKSGNRNDTMDTVVGRIIERLKHLAEEADIPVLVISQMNRNSENRAERSFKPEVHDLRDSGSIEQVADCIIFVYNPYRHGILKDPVTHFSYKNAGVLSVKKCRNGSIGEARFVRNSTFTIINNPEDKLPL